MIIAIEANNIEEFNEKIKEIEAKAESVFLSSSNCFRVDNEGSYYQHYTAIIEVELNPLNMGGGWK